MIRLKNHGKVTKIFWLKKKSFEVKKVSRVFEGKRVLLEVKETKNESRVL